MKKVIGIIIILLGVVLVGFGIYSFFNVSELERKCTEKAMATVIEMVEEEYVDSEDESNIISSSAEYSPTIEFFAQNGAIQEKLPLEENNDKYDIGEEIEIYYNPNNPSQFYIKKEKKNNLIPIISIAIGIVFIGVGTVLLVKNKNE